MGIETIALLPTRGCETSAETLSFGALAFIYDTTQGNETMAQLKKILLVDDDDDLRHGPYSEY